MPSLLHRARVFHPFIPSTTHNLLSLTALIPSNVPPSTHLSVHSPTHPSIFPPTYLSPHPFTHSSTGPPFIRPHTYPFIHSLT